MVKGLEKNPSILQPCIFWRMKMNLSPSTGNEDLCFFAPMEKESGKAHQKGTIVCLGALWENGGTVL